MCNVCGTGRFGGTGRGGAAGMVKRGSHDSPIMAGTRFGFDVRAGLNVGDNGFARQPQFRQIYLQRNPNQFHPRFLGRHRSEQPVSKHRTQWRQCSVDNIAIALRRDVASRNGTFINIRRCR